MSSSERILGSSVVVGAWVRLLDWTVSLVVLKVRTGAKSAVSVSEAPAPLDVPFLWREDCRLAGPAELPAEIDGSGARDESLLSVSEVMPSLSGCHLAYFLFAS